MARHRWLLACAMVLGPGEAAAALRRACELVAANPALTPPRKLCGGRASQ
jgi:hypothetical protein